MPEQFKTDCNTAQWNRVKRCGRMLEMLEIHGSVLCNIVTCIKLYDIVFQHFILYYRIYYIISDYIFQVFWPFCRESRKSRATCVKGILPPQFGSCQPVESSVTRGDRQSACLTFRMMSGRPRTWRQDLFKPGES